MESSLISWLVAAEEGRGHWDVVDGVVIADAHKRLEDRRFEPAWALHEVGLTGLALAALASYPENESAQDCTDRAVRWLGNQQTSAGQIGPDIGIDTMNGHLIASWALGAAAEGGCALPQSVLDAAIGFTIAEQNADGGWGYHHARFARSDTHHTSWALAGLLQARRCGVVVDAGVIRSGVDYLRTAVDLTSASVIYSRGRIPHYQDEDSPGTMRGSENSLRAYPVVSPGSLLYAVAWVDWEYVRDYCAGHGGDTIVPLEDSDRIADLLSGSVTPWDHGLDFLRAFWWLSSVGCDDGNSLPANARVRDVIRKRIMSMVLYVDEDTAFVIPDGPWASDVGGVTFSTAIALLLLCPE